MTGHDLVLDFAGEVYELRPDAIFSVGRQGDVAIDDNPYLHRRLLELSCSHRLWWVANVGNHIIVELTDAAGRGRSTLGPGGRMPVVFERSYLTFSAGPTAYELELSTEGFRDQVMAAEGDGSDGSTIVPSGFTRSQLLAILALAEPVLRHPGTGAWNVRTAVEAAERLGWTQTRFTRKLDNVCDKLDRAGVQGLKGGPSGQAANRRIRLVEYATTSRLVTATDLPLLAAEARAVDGGMA